MILLEPDYNLNSVYELPIDDLQRNGIKLLLFDLDSTIMASKTGIFTEETKLFLSNLRKFFKIAVVSNNSNISYIQKSCKSFDIPFYYNAKKPNTRIILKILEDFGVSTNQAVIVGDRPLTDILAGKNANMKTVLVDSITAKTEKKIVRFARFLERLTIKKSK